MRPQSQAPATGALARPDSHGEAADGEGEAVGARSKRGLPVASIR